MSAAPDMPQAERDEQAALWCLELADGPLGSEQRLAFDRWIADSDNARALEEASRVLGIAMAASDSPELIHMRSDALEDFRRMNVRRWQKPLWTRWPMIGAIAASFIVAIVTAAIFFGRPQVYETGIGERHVAMLDDGSKLSLDADTQVDVKLRGDRRELTLIHGRAKFDVAKDPLRPFTVTAGDKMIVATGTSFSVEMLGGQVHVLLYEGHVAVLDKTSSKPIADAPSRPGKTAAAADQLLTPGRELIAKIDMPAPATIQMVDPARSLSWEAGQLSFDDEPLQSAVLRMNRYSATKLEVGDRAAANVRINGVFSAGDTDAFVEGVTALAPLRASRTGESVTLRSN